MTIPFLSYFKKKGAKVQPTPVAPAPTAVLEKPSSERLSKTVMPNVTRPSGPQNSFGGQTAPAFVPPPANVAQRMISFGQPMSDRQAGLPPAVALALEPKVERTVSLELADVVRHVAAGLVRELSNDDGSRRVLLKASELEKGMACGKPSVSLSTIFQQVPEIFVREIASSDSTQVILPVDKVLEQFNKLHVRADQHDAPAVPQVETPFLKVTLEDDVKFGTKTEVLKSGPLPAVRVELATAETIAAAEPEATFATRFVYPQTPAAPASSHISSPAVPKSNGTNGNGTNGHVAPPPKAHPPAPPPRDLKPTSAPARIPFKLTPTGTDAPAPERVPASNGPSVPNSPAKPTRIPFKVSGAPKDACSEDDPWLTKESFENGTNAASEEAPASAVALAPEPAKPTELTIKLTLKPILQSLPPFQLKGDVNDVPKDARIELPFALIEPQLASGRVILTPEDFGKALPEEYRSLFNGDEAAATISLPLQEVLKNLPGASLRMRDDQIEQEKGADFATPFSAKAQEDAKRFKVSGTPVAKPAVAAEPVPTAPVAPVVVETPAVVPQAIAMPTVAAPAPVAAEPVNIVPDAVETEEQSTSEPAPADASTGRTALQMALETDDELDAKAAVAHLGKMAGVKACAIMFGDGLSLAGNLPEEYEADGLCAMAPSLLKRVENHMIETKLGELRAMTLSCANAAVTFFMHGNLCLAALHAKEELASDVRERLSRAVHALSIQYSNPA